MHIGFDISQTGTHKAGCGYFAHAMLQSLLDYAPEHTYTLFPSFGDFFFDPRMPLKLPYSGKQLVYGPRHFVRALASNFWRDPALEKALKNPDIIHANNYWCPDQSLSSRIIYTCHDLSVTVEPAWSTETNRVGCFEGLFRASIYADWIAANSQATRTHFLKVFPHFPEERIRVVYPYPRLSVASLKGKSPKALKSIENQRFWLSVGTIEPRKNQRFLVKAYARYLGLGGEPMPLILAGGKGWLMEAFESEIIAEGLAEHVKLIGYVSDQELVWLYQHCYANLYPSLFEGFGLPVLEGMQCGAPTIISSSTSLPEVGGDAAIQIGPDDLEGWAQAMLTVSQDRHRRDQLRDMSKAQAARFNWQHSAKALLALY